MTTGEKIDAALRSWNDAHSMALRLQKAGVADELICTYLHNEAECLSTFFDVARRRLDGAVLTAGGNSPSIARHAV